ncbi:MAG TPA: hypothetical protein VGI81_15125, partial [Tepidisphaeraceae bacterium]|jgi:hypothetical protein
LPNGFQQKDLTQIDNIRGALATVTEDAITRRDFGKVIGNLAVEDRDRMKDYKNQDFKVLDGVAGQINQDWKQKYGHDFDIKAAKNVFTDREVIVQGVVTDPKVAAAAFPVPAEAGEQAHRAAAKEKAQQAQQGQAEQVESKDLQESKGAALTRFPAHGNLPEITVSMIEEGHGKWRIAVPASLTSQQVHTQLQNQLTYFGRDMKQWPADEAMAYRQVAHHVLMALYDVNAPQAELNK